MPRPLLNQDFKGIKNFEGCLEVYPNALVVGQLLRDSRQQMLDAAKDSPEEQRWTMMGLVNWVNDAFLGQDRDKSQKLFAYTLYQKVETEGSQPSTGAPYISVLKYIATFARHLYDIGYDEQFDLPVYLYNPATEEPFTFNELMEMAEGRIRRDGSPNPAFKPLEERIKNLAKVRVADEIEDTE